MPRIRLSTPVVLADKLFDGPLTFTYLVTGLVSLLTGATLTYSTPGLSDMGRFFVMMGTLLGVTRLFNSRPLRWTWGGLMVLLRCSCLRDCSCSCKQ